MSSYVTLALMGGRNAGMLTTLIYQQFVVTYNWHFGAALVVVLLDDVVDRLGTCAVREWPAHARLAGEAMMARLYRAGSTPAWALYAFMLAPLICVVMSRSTWYAVQSFPPRGYRRLTWYWHALNEPSFVSGAITSAVLALCATGLATPAGVAAALALHRSRWRGKAAIELLLLAPLAVPGLVIGIALLVTLAGMMCAKRRCAS